MIIFAFLFGLSMDYEVFILARMREEYDATGDTTAAVTVGLGRTGRLVTSAALILFFAFAALASSPGTDIKVMGTALGVGILIDATIVRALLVPALVSLFGEYNWWLPVWMAKILRVEPSPLGGVPRKVPDEDKDKPASWLRLIRSTDDRPGRSPRPAAPRAGRSDAGRTARSARRSRLGCPTPSRPMSTRRSAAAPPAVADQSASAGDIRISRTASAIASGIDDE